MAWDFSTDPDVSPMEPFGVPMHDRTPERR